MKNKFVIIGAILLLVVLGFFTAKNLYLNQESSDTSEQVISSTNGTSQDVQMIRDFNNSTGPELAKVTVVEFFDPECEGCSAFYPHLKTVLNQYEGQIRFVARYMLYHSSSHMAAMASQAASKQGKFWEYHQMLFEKQAEWGHKPSPEKQFFLGYAKLLGLDLVKFEVEMQNQETSAQLSIDVADGNALGVKGTPTIFVNGQMLENLDANLLKSMIEERLK